MHIPYLVVNIQKTWYPVVMGWILGSHCDGFSHHLMHPGVSTCSLMILQVDRPVGHLAEELKKRKEIERNSVNFPHLQTSG